MPKFYFHVLDDMDIQDEEGVELRDLEAARAYAASSARVLMCETLKDHGRITLHHRIDVEDEQGAVLTTVPFADAVKIDS